LSNSEDAGLEERKLKNDSEHSSMNQLKSLVLAKESQTTHSKASLMTTRGVNMGYTKRKTVKYFVNDYSNLPRGNVFDIKKVVRKFSKPKNISSSGRKRTRQSEDAPTSSKRTQPKPEAPSQRESQRKAFKITKSNDKSSNSQVKNGSKKPIKPSKPPQNPSKLSKTRQMSSLSTTSSPNPMPQNPKTPQKSHSKPSKSKLSKQLLAHKLKKRGPKKIKRAYKEEPIVHLSLTNGKL